MAVRDRLGGDGMQINWTLVAGLAACLLAAAACWDAGTAAGRVERARRRPWRVLAIVFWLLAAEQVLGLRFGVIDAGMEGASRHAVQIGAALAMLAVAGGALFAIMRVGRWVPGFVPAGLAAVAMALSFAVEMLAVGAIGAVLYRPVGPVLVAGWWWLAIGAVAVAVGVRVARRR